MQDIIGTITQFWTALQSGEVAPVGFWAYPLLSILVAVEGPVAILLAAAAASTGLMNPVYVFFAASAGNLTADTGWYMVGYLGKLDWLKKGGKRVGINPALFDRLRDRLHEHAVKVMFLAKVTNGFIIPTLIVAGIARVPWRKWFPFIAIGETLVTGLLIWIAFHAGASLLSIEKGFGAIILALSAAFALGAILFLRGSRVREEIFDRFSGEGGEEN